MHTFLRSDSKWIPKVYVFGHTSPAVVQQWTQRIQSRLHEDSHRPKTLLVCFIHKWIIHVISCDATGLHVLVG